MIIEIISFYNEKSISSVKCLYKIFRNIDGDFELITAINLMERAVV